jgi:hypothetical protein
MRGYAQSRFQGIAPFVPILADEQAPFWGCGVASPLGSVPEYLGRVLCAIDEQIGLEEAVETTFFEHPSYALFGFLAYIRYDPEPDSAAAQPLEHIRNLRVNVQPLEPVRRSGGEANGPERVPNVKESRG